LTSPRAAGTIEEVWKATFLEQDVNDAASMITNDLKLNSLCIIKVFSFFFKCNFFL
jgi:hypothetical protein